MSEEIIRAFKYQVEKLEERLEDIYTIDIPSDYIDSRAKGGKVNILKEVEFLTEYERAYSVIETSGVDSGDLYQEYSKFLGNARKAKAIAEKELEKVKDEHADDIKNAEVLLKQFKQYLSIEESFK